MFRILIQHIMISLPIRTVTLLRFWTVTLLRLCDYNGEFISEPCALDMLCALRCNFAALGIVLRGQLSATLNAYAQCCACYTLDSYHCRNVEKQRSR